MEYETIQREKCHPFEYRVSKINQKEANQGKMGYNACRKMITQDPKNIEKEDQNKTKGGLLQLCLIIIIKLTVRAI